MLPAEPSESEPQLQARGIASSKSFFSSEARAEQQTSSWRLMLADRARSKSSNLRNAWSSCRRGKEAPPGAPLACASEAESDTCLPPRRSHWRKQTQIDEAAHVIITLDFMQREKARSAPSKASCRTEWRPIHDFLFITLDLLLARMSTLLRCIRDLNIEAGMCLCDANDIKGKNFMMIFAIVASVGNIEMPCRP